MKNRYLQIKKKLITFDLSYTVYPNTNDNSYSKMQYKIV